ncbi:MAG TPA: 1,2-phenylacetyl-CoA epoxidase subunit PaaB [Gemmatimonadaceae bacterium]|nr:1,2-phenylacetyl-CoA epoxidase subunit PaaB [Gemmatimonadaceae bacterium]
MSNGSASNANGETSWPLWEVFAQSEAGAPHEHVGSIHAVDAESALQNARDVYARRGNVVSLWMVPSDAIIASRPEDSGSLFEPGEDKIYRHPQFYKVPRGMKGF